MPLFVGLTVAALFATLPVNAPRAVGKTAPQTIAKSEEQPPRVEIGPAVLTIYDENGKIISVE